MSRELKTEEFSVGYMLCLPAIELSSLILFSGVINKGNHVKNGYFKSK